MGYRIVLRRDTSARWQRNNPTLRLGEPGYETDSRKIKIGDGVSPWTILPYLNFDLSGINRDVWVDKEVPSGEIDGINLEYTLANALVEGSEHVYLNGQLLDADGDYGVEGNTLTFVFSPLPGSKIRVTYRTPWG
jgi:hypothetical protein